MKLDVGNIYLLIAAGLLIASLIKDPAKTKRALAVTGNVALTVLPVLLLIFVLMGVIEAFVPRQTIVSLLGSGRGVFSIIIGELLGSFALFQPAAVFPFAGFLRKSGAGYGAALGFVMSAMLIGLSTLPLEIQTFGGRFTLTRNLLSFLLILALGVIFMVVL
jgi:uncharacterized membrane protein YraQ (UPF0718 family)